MTGAFGKLPAQGDFVRIHASGALAQQLIHWLEDGNETLHRSGARLSAEPFAFLFRGAAPATALVGVLGPGVDRVGRAFPLVIFAEAEGADLAQLYPLVPATCRAFFDAARAIHAEAAALTAAQLAAKLDDLPAPNPREPAAAAAFAHEAGSGSTTLLLERLFGAGGQRYYAFHTFLVACKPPRDPGRTNVALDCPCASDADVWAWLELSRRVLAWASPPPFFWRTGSAPRLVLSLGTPPPALLALFSEPARESPKIWPLRTQHQPAIALAQRSLSAAQLSAIDRPDSTVGELLDSFSPA